MSDKKPNDSSAVSQVLEVVPVIVSVEDREGNPIDNNGSTSSNEITLKGTGTKGMMLHTFDEELRSGSSPFKVGEDGNWSITYSYPPTSGRFSYRMKSSYGNQLESNAWVVNIT
jgi:hypothetical protein